MNIIFYKSGNKGPTRLLPCLFMSLFMMLFALSGKSQCNTSAGTSSTPVLCKGQANGAASVTASGGVAPYSYLWSDGSTNAAVSGLPAGTYSVTVSDALQCTAVTLATITEPTALSVAVPVVTNAVCSSANGAVYLNPVGGTAPYTFTWSNNASSPDIAGLIAGNYIVSITDANACTVHSTISVGNSNTVINASLNVTTTTNCTNTTATISVSPTNGTAPFMYNWSNSSNTQTQNNVAAGTYSVTITDANGCMGTLSNIVVNNTTPPGATIRRVGDVACFGAASGSIMVEARGGTAPYNYLWSNGDSTAAIADLLAGTYSLTLSDANGCTFTIGAITVAEPAALSAAITATNPSGIGMADAGIAIAVDGGVTPYGFYWSNGETTQNLSGLTAGTYDLIVTDANNCIFNSSVLVEDGPLAVEVTTESGHFHLYPNPTENQIFIDFGIELKAVSFRLYSMNGALLEQHFLQNAKLVTLSLEQYASGMYILEIIPMQGKSGIFKLIKR